MRRRASRQSSGGVSNPGAVVKGGDAVLVKEAPRSQWLGSGGRRLDVFVCLHLLFGSQLGVVLATRPGKLAALAGFSVLGHRLVTFRRWRDETEHAKRFFRAFFVLVLWLGFENCMIWAVSASDKNRETPMPALQDNVVELYYKLLNWLPPTPRGWLVYAFEHEWISIKEKLVALIALGFASVFDEVPFSGFGMCTRVVVCITGARAIRTAAFLMTIIPSPRPGPPTCFQRRFPPVPDTWLAFFKIGFAKLRSGGGCNDLILSGHGVIYSAVVAAFQEFFPHSWATPLLWLALARSNLRAALTLQHYSVDMFLATTVTVLTFKACEHVYPTQESRLKARPPGSPPDPKGPLQWALTAAVFAVLGVLAIIIIAGGA